MTGFLLDTNAVSELRKPRPNAGYIAWIKSIPERLLFISSVTIGELRVGIELSADSSKKRDLERWFVSEVTLRFGSRILAFDEAVAERWGRIEAAARRASGELPIFDGMIAATALHHGLPVVTRNGSDFVRAGIDVIDPWSAPDP